MSDLFEDVAGLIREAAEREIMPRFRSLSDEDIHEKAKNDLVTTADRNAEAWLTPELEKLLPGSRVLGEEAVAEDHSLLEIVRSDIPFWTVDPVDGTGNFVDGKETFGVMVALVEEGVTTHAWVYLPVPDEMFMAEHGGGTILVADENESAVHVPPAPGELSGAMGALNDHYMPEPWKARIGALAPRIGRRASVMCSAWEYTNIMRGRQHFAVYYRMMPWDHAPTTLLLREAGGVMRRIDTGVDYDARSESGPHLAAASEELWGLISKEVLSTSV